VELLELLTPVVVVEGTDTGLLVEVSTEALVVLA
jgi:hypothetical protein